MLYYGPHAFYDGNPSMFKGIRFLFILVLILGVVAFLAKDWLIKEVFASAVQTLTGFDAKAKGLRVDLGKAAFHLEGLILLNPGEFEERIFADVPEIYLRMNLIPLLRGERTHINELRLYIRELNIEKTKTGVSNVSLLTSVKKSGPPSTPSAKKKSMPFQLDRFELSLRKVSYHDRSSLVSKKLSLDMHAEKLVFEGIQDPKSIINIILMKIMSATPFDNLGINTAEIKNQLRSSVKTVRDFGERVFRKETFGQVGSAAKEEVSNLFGKFRAKIGPS